LVAPHVERHTATLVRGTAPGAGSADSVTRYVTYGASPRGGQALVLGAKVLALLDARPHVNVDDVDRMATAAPGHRLVLNFPAQAAGIGAPEIVGHVLAAARRSRT